MDWMRLWIDVPEDDAYTILLLLKEKFAFVEIRGQGEGRAGLLLRSDTARVEFERMPPPGPIPTVEDPFE